MEGQQVAKTELGFEVEQSTLTPYDETQWKAFVEQNHAAFPNLTLSGEGLFVPSVLKGYVRPSPRIIPNAFHELFGHGLFCEHSSSGKTLVERAREGAGDAYLQEWKGREETGLSGPRIVAYEGFALWTEGFLSDATGNGDAWRRKLDAIPQEAQELWAYAAKTEGALTRKGFLRQLGFPVEVPDKDVVQLLRNVYGARFSDISMVVVSGSELPGHDLDLYVVHNGAPRNWNTGWLDVGEYNARQLEADVDNLDIAALSTLFEGRAVYDPENAFGRLRERALDADITEDAIAQNERSAQRNSEFRDKLVPSLQRVADGYTQSFRAQAAALREGTKLLTRDDVEAYLGHEAALYTPVPNYRPYIAPFPGPDPEPPIGPHPFGPDPEPTPDPFNPWLPRPHPNEFIIPEPYYGPVPVPPRLLFWIPDLNGPSPRPLPGPWNPNDAHPPPIARWNSGTGPTITDNGLPMSSVDL